MIEFRTDCTAVLDKLSDVWRALAAFDYDRAVGFYMAAEPGIARIERLNETGSAKTAARNALKRLNRSLDTHVKAMNSAMHDLMSEFSKSELSTKQQDIPNGEPYVIFAHRARQSVSVRQLEDAGLVDMYENWIKHYTAVNEGLEMIRILKRLIREQDTMLKQVRDAWSEAGVLIRQLSSIRIFVKGIRSEELTTNDFAD